ncbi:MAG: DNA polymerase IV [Firmicutes bacterium]|nr:DNA polymerase IV [Bacillota bacterium]
MISKNKDRVILHCDMNGFFAAVELLDHPELKDKPMAVSGDPDSRHGIILAKNQLAKDCGVVTAETIWKAKQKCPDLQLVRPHMSKYKYYCNEINKIYQRFTDMVEPFSIDESWLDVTASQSLFGSGKEIADTIRETVKSELGLTLSAGVSFNKTLAKMGSEYKKPDATTEITRDNFKELLWPLPAKELFGVGRATAEKLSKAGIKTIGDIACADKKLLVSLFGKHGGVMWEHANGIDDSPVALYSDREPIKSVGNGVTFKRDLVSQQDIATAVTALSDTVAGRLRKYGLKAYGVKVDIKDPYFKVISRQKQLYAPTWLAEEIAKHSIDIINTSWKKGAPIRMLTITGINLTDELSQEQLSLFDENIDRKEKMEKVEFTMDEVRKKYGTDIIGFASVLNNDLGLSIKRDESKKDEE